MTLAIGCALALLGAGLAVGLAERSQLPLWLCALAASAPFLLYLLGLALRRPRQPRPRLRRAPRFDRKDALGLVLVLATALVLLHPALFLGRGLVPANGLGRFPPWRERVDTAGSNRLLSDQFLELVPQQHFWHQQLLRGDLPLWNPYLACGVPNAASMQSAPFFPVNLLLAPLDPFASRGLAALLKLWLAGLFTYLYVRRLGRSRAAATLAGLSFAFGAFMIVWLGHPHSNVALWLPLLLFLIEGEFSGDRGRRGWVAFAAATGAMALGGHPPTIVHVSACALAYCVFRGIASHREGKTRAHLARLAGALACGLALAAVQLLPFLEYTRESSSALAARALERSHNQLPLQALLYFLLPYASGSPTAGFEGLAASLGLAPADNFNERTGFFGVLPLYLALVAVSAGRQRAVTFHALLALASACAVFGLPPLPQISNALPVLRDIDPRRLLLVVGFCGAVLAAFGLDTLRRSPSQGGTRAALAVTWLVAGALVAGLWVRLGPALRDPEAFGFALRQVAVLAVALGAGTALTLWARRARAVVALGLGALILELLWFAWGINPSIERSAYYPETPGIRALREDPSPSRILPLGRVLPANTAMMFGLHDVRGRDFLTVRRYEELIAGEAGEFGFLRWLEELPPSALTLSAKYVVTARGAELPAPLFEPVHRGEISVYRTQAYVERARIVREVEVLARHEVLARVRSGRFDPRERLLLEAPPHPFPEGARKLQATARDAVRIERDEPDAVVVEARLAEPGYLLLLDTYFPGWQARVDGRRTPLYRADYNFRAVALPAGASRVRFLYRPASFSAGLALSLMCAGLLGFLSWREGHQRALTGTEGP